jgi:hypothetical protein
MGRDSEVNLTKMNKDDNLKNRVRVQMYRLNFEVVEQAAEEIAAWDPKSSLKNDFDTTISQVLGVGMSLPLTGHHWSTTHGGRRWSLTSLRIPLSLTVEDLNISGCEVAMDVRLVWNGRRKKK